MQHMRECPEVLHLKDLHCTKIVQKKVLPCSGMRGRARGEGRSGWLASRSCKSVARFLLTVNLYYALAIIRMILGLEIEDSRGDSAVRSCLSHSHGERAATLRIKRGERKYVSRIEARFDFSCSKGAVFRGHDWVTNAAREFVIRSAFEASARLLLADSAPLFEEERNAILLALIAKRQDPFFLHRPGARPALTTYDHPVDASQ